MTTGRRVALVVVVAAVTAVVSVIILRPGHHARRPRPAPPALPVISGPTVEVRVGYAGASPERVEADVTTVVEDALGGLDGLRTISSSSTAGEAVLTLELAPDVASAPVAAEVQKILDRVTFPAGVQRAVVTAR